MTRGGAGSAPGALGPPLDVDATLSIASMPLSAPFRVTNTLPAATNSIAAAASPERRHHEMPGERAGARDVFRVAAAAINSTSESTGFAAGTP